MVNSVSKYLYIFLFISMILGFTLPSFAEQEESPGAGGMLIPIEGEIDKFQVIFLRRSIEKAKDAGVETVVFSINTFGGRVDSALQMATLIGSLDEIETIAYIPSEPESLGVSWSAGALISFSCNGIYMSPGTSIGAAAPVFQSAEGSQAAGEKTVSAVRTQLAALAEKNGYPKGVAIAMVDKDAELVERSFALVLDRGGMRRTWLRGRANVQKRYLLHVAGYNLGLIMCRLAGHRTPREAAAARRAAVGIAFLRDDALILVVIALVDDDAASSVLIILVGAHG